MWAVLGSPGCKEKNLPTTISVQLFGMVFSTFWGPKKMALNLKKNTLASGLKSYIIFQCYKNEKFLFLEFLQAFESQNSR